MPGGVEQLLHGRLRELLDPPLSPQLLQPRQVGRCRPLVRPVDAPGNRDQRRQGHRDRDEDEQHGGHLLPPQFGDGVGDDLAHAKRRQVPDGLQPGDGQRHSLAELLLDLRHEGHALHGPLGDGGNGVDLGRLDVSPAIDAGDLDTRAGVDTAQLPADGAADPGEWFIAGVRDDVRHGSCLPVTARHYRGPERLRDQRTGGGGDRDDLAQTTDDSKA